MLECLPTDWQDLEAIGSHVKDVLTMMASDRMILTRLLGELPDRQELVELCEHHEVFDKLVLLDEPGLGVRLRLHIFQPGYFDRPHSHRWSFGAVVLFGSYEHRLFGTEDAVGHDAVHALRPLMVRIEAVGSSYVLHDSIVHSVVAQPYTVSLILRGPAVKRRAVTMDRSTKEKWWKYGAQDESEAEKAPRRMTPDRIRGAVRELQQRGVVPTVAASGRS